MNITGSAKYRKAQKRSQMPLLPGDMSLLREMERQRAANRNKQSIEQPLENIGSLKNYIALEHPINPRRGGAELIDMCVVVRSILAHQWSEFPLKENSNDFALSSKIVAETAEARSQFPHAVTHDQIYGVFPYSTTLVDQAISRDCRRGLIRVIPISSRDSTTLDLIMEATEFYKVLDPINPSFAAHCRAKPDQQWFDSVELRIAGVDIPLTLAQGFLVTDPRKPGAHNLAIPSQGRLLKLVRLTRQWLVKTVTSANRKFHELPETQIQERLMAPKRYWTQFYGVCLDWILYGAIGCGWVDGFQTPMGRGWKALWAA